MEQLRPSPLCLQGTAALQPLDKANERIEQYRQRSGVGMKGELHLTGLALDSLPQPLFGLRHLTNLKELYLAHNKLGAIPDQLAQLASLEKLDLTSNLLVEFPQAVSQVAHSGIHFRDCGPAQADHPLCAHRASRSWLGTSSAVPPGSSPRSPRSPRSLGLGGLVSARLAPSALCCSVLPCVSPQAVHTAATSPRCCGAQAVTRLTQLKALHLSRNRLKQVPEAVGSLKALQWLDLRRNALQQGR